MAAADSEPGRGPKAYWIALPVVVAALLLTLVMATRDSALERGASSPLLGGLAPSVTGETTDEETFDLDDWRGRWVLVNFFSTTCVPCIIEHPELVEFAQRHSGAGDARIVSIVFDDSERNVREFFAKNGGDWPVLAQGAGAAAVSFGVTGVPESYLVAPSGIVVWKQLGGVTADAIDSVIDRMESR